MNNSQNNNNKQNKQIKQQNKQQNINNQIQTKATVMDLEKLKIEYSLQLNSYNQAISDYINYLQQNVDPPCSSFSPNSTGISQACYNDIWQKSGCGTGNVSPNASNSWAAAQSLNGLINDAWLWATMTDTNHRNGCYGPNNTNYNTTTAPDFNINAQPMTTMPGKVFWGSGQAGTQSVYTGGTQEQCKALCSSTVNCSGATFNPTAHGQPMCWLRSGEGQVTTGLDTDVAIIPEVQKYLMTIESINSKLIQTNQQIQNIINDSDPLYNTMKNEGVEKNKELLQSYAQLVAEREKIAEVLKTYETLEQSQIEGENTINKKQYSYILLSIISIGVIILLYKISGMFTSQTASTAATTPNFIQTGGENSQTVYYILVIIIIFILIAKHYTNIKGSATQMSNSVYNTVSSIF